MVCKPKISAAKLDVLRMRLRFDFSFCNLEGSIWIFFNKLFQHLRKGSNEQHITVEFSHPQLPCPIISSFVHAKCNAQDRLQLWSALEAYSDVKAPWVVCGDFYVVLGDHENSSIFCHRQD